jgi:hypothetical protein
MLCRTLVGALWFSGLLFLFCTKPLMAEEPTAALLPDELHGVWTVTSWEQDGRKFRVAQEGDSGLDAGDVNVNEIIIARDRLVFVEYHEGAAWVAKAALMENELGEQIRLWGGRYDGHEVWMIYRFQGEELTVSIFHDNPKGHPPMDFDPEKGVRQKVIVLKKAPAADPRTIKAVDPRPRAVGVGRRRP